MCPEHAHAPHAHDVLAEWKLCAGRGLLMEKCSGKEVEELGPHVAVKCQENSFVCSSDDVFNLNFVTVVSGVCLIDKCALLLRSRRWLFVCMKAGL